MRRCEGLTGYNDGIRMTYVLTCSISFVAARTNGKVHITQSTSYRSSVRSPRYYNPLYYPRGGPTGSTMDSVPAWNKE